MIIHPEVWPIFKKNVRLMSEGGGRNKDALCQLRVVCICLVRRRVDNVYDIRLLLQPVGPVGVDRKARHERSRGAQLGTSMSFVWHATALIPVYLLVTVTQVQGVKNSNPGCEHWCSPFWDQDEELLSL